LLLFSFDVVYGQQGGMMEYVMGEALKVEKFVEKIKQIHMQVHETLKKSWETYKAWHDRHRIEKSFEVGELPDRGGMTFGRLG
jgi:hypothetical protein